jgi:hypothetical protein
LWKYSLIGGAVALLVLAATVTLREDEAPAEPQPHTGAAQQELRPPATVLQDTASRQAESNLATDERQLTGDFATAESALNRSSDESFFLQQGDDRWQRDLESLKRDVAEFESMGDSFQ